MPQTLGVAAELCTPKCACVCLRERERRYVPRATHGICDMTHAFVCRDSLMRVAATPPPVSATERETVTVCMCEKKRASEQERLMEGREGGRGLERERGEERGRRGGGEKERERERGRKGVGERERERESKQKSERERASKRKSKNAQAIERERCKEGGGGGGGRGGERKKVRETVQASEQANE